MLIYSVCLSFLLNFAIFFTEVDQDIEILYAGKGFGPLPLKTIGVKRTCKNFIMTFVCLYTIFCEFLVEFLSCFVADKKGITPVKVNAATATITRISRIG